MIGRSASLSAAGLFVGAVAWALHQQAGIILASWDCADAPSGVGFSGLLAGLLLAVGAAASWFAWRAMQPSDGAGSRRLLAMVGLMAAALFAFAIILQVSAAYFLPGCAG